MQQKMRVPFNGPSYEARSLNADAQRCINFYLESDKQSPRAPATLYGTPGLLRKATCGGGPTRGAIVASATKMYVVSNNTVYSIDNQFNVTAIGTLNTVAGIVSLATNGPQVLIVDGVNGYVINTTTDTVTQITSINFPNGVTLCVFLSGFFIVGGDGSQNFSISDIYNGLSWSGFTSAISTHPFPLTGMVASFGELYLANSVATEVWVDTGATNFPFSPASQTVMENGVINGFTMAIGASSIFWLGSDAQGVGPVWMARGYVPQRISTPPVERSIQSIARNVGVQDAFAFTYQQEGHLFYVLTFPSGQQTWVYDVKEGLWHERAYWITGQARFTRWRPSFCVNFAGRPVVGDYLDGRVYEVSLDTFTDDGDILRSVRRTQTSEQLQNRIFYSEIVVDVEAGVGRVTGQGSDPAVMLAWSDDGGHTYTGARQLSLGKIGETTRRCKATQLGSGRNRVWELAITDPVKRAVLGAVVTGEVAKW